MLKNLPLLVGILGSGLLVLNRTLATPTPEQTRADALGLMMAAVLVLVGILARPAQPVTAATITITAPQGTEIAPVSPQLAQELQWLGESLLTNTAAVSLLVWDQGRVLLRMGYLATEDFITGPIVERVLQTQKPVYLVSLKLFPGRVEFSYLPMGMQAIVCQPLGNLGVLVLGANQERSFTPQDLQWIAVLAKRLALTLDEKRE
ncbi:cofactor assembly of complex C subunit B [Candidatus Cyanaurora vandensis]|uniref:cofactor assembly of complex C subunit B n=1 Tax=Candidatus Cyanaurora vandensis TaxID=2714958 RepID=UPI00257F17D2|nr:cofactor assembly of complex C subunit B [Candidatus Cyanaurora vandensis]